ncbi:type IV inositol polyphosphate 5-phosphatase 9-like isoform X2 [Nymphaea colorata]|nr:type IV inositol polyphosphate 5-phosphatase 9-like isoform X2 [Nymphaea colorata]
MGGIPPPEDLNLEEWLDTGDGSYDIYVLGFQEIVPLSAGNVLRTENPSICTKWHRLIRSALNEKASASGAPLLPQEQQQQKQRIYPVGREKAAGEFQCIASKQMVGIMISVWARRTLLKFIHHPSVSCVGCGLMGCLGNKGSVSVRFLLHGTSFCFVCCHLASGGKEGDEILRNRGVSQIMLKTKFPAGPSMDLPTSILSHDRVIWLGDLNYRISLPELETRSLVERHEWRSLHENDQLRVELSEGGVFHGWHEGTIEFAPTYKYSHGSDEYYGSDNGGNRKKKRAPAWCDRILWHGKAIKQNLYERGEMRHSDHRPVRATFTIRTDVTNSTKASKNLIFSSARCETRENWSVVGNGN